MGDSEYYVKVSRGQEFFHALFKPLLLIILLTGRAMPVPAGVIIDLVISTMGAYLFMCPQTIAAAHAQQTQNTLLLAGKLVRMNIPRGILFEKTAQGDLSTHDLTSPII
jgi:hypothetical protein